ncbi:S-locus glycoprotein domain-containing protein [Artemisia annua]|uniref:Receptor-like serine/threonine-protein kinase n=1 Tax=Artemisia annua TaxID=35608 RepID=A0A2U1QD59_ARTAN|nr:S-locus glycoprotein domain-containing protein [Artemisia annua]
MHLPLLLLLLLVTFYHSANIATALSSSVLTQGSSLHVENEDHLISPNRHFTAGFHRIGLNAYCFAIWFSEPTSDGSHTFVWMANRDEPVNGRRSKISLWRNGNLVLKDVNRRIWTTNTQSSSPLKLELLDSGNLVLKELDDKQSSLWQSFSFPTNTILPNQLFTKDTFLISSKSSKNFSSGYYKLYFDNDNVIRLLYNNDEVTSVYWPSPWLLPWQEGRSTYNSSRIAMLDSEGHFISSDQLSFYTTDYGPTLQRRLTLDADGNIRVYSLIKRRWIVSWQAISKPCAISGNCGPNSLCTYSSGLGRSCTCMHGYKAKSQSDSWLGCEPTFDLSQDHENYDFIRLPYVEFIGFELRYLPNATLSECKMACLDDIKCKAFQYQFEVEDMAFECYTKNLLVNGVYKGNPFTTYLKLPKIDVLSYHQNVAKETPLHCSNSTIELKRTYDKESENGSLKFMKWFSIILSVIEGACFLFFYYVTRKPSGATTQNYLPIATGFRRFTYDEIMKATHKFRDEIGRGGGGVVYKGILPDNRVAAIKRLHEAFDGEAEFLAEMSTIGRINHKNLIETYGYCAEGKHRILVYEYMENGSLAKNLGADQLDWHKRIEIASGVAEGLAYLHEECLEWVLHSDFGLSKLFNQVGIENSIFSKIRGTRGYMAPEWVFNLPITSKVDVYSYGMVVLEMITGRSPTSDQTSDDNQSGEQKTLLSWVRDKVQEEGLSWTEEQIMDIVDPMIRDGYEKGLMKNLLTVALQCVEEDKDARPTMSEVVKMLHFPDIDDASSI